MKKALLVIIAVVAIAAVIAGGWYYYHAEPPRFNLVVISIDGLRPDHLGCYGYKRDTSPAIDRLADEGALFKTTASSSTWSLPAHTALMTGLHDPVHSVRDVNDSLDPKRITLAEVLQKNGYRTGAVFTGRYLRPGAGLDQGFDNYMHASGDRADVPSGKGRASRTAVLAMETAEDWLSGLEARKPFFLFIQLSDLTSDLDPPEKYRNMFDPDYGGTIDGKGMYDDPRINPDVKKEDLEHLKALYDGMIRYVDDKGISRLLSFLKSEKLGQNTVVIITSPHGFEFFEHGSLGFGNNLYDTTLVVPLIIWRPGMVPAVEIEKQANIVDVMPTIADLMGIAPAGEALGESLCPRFQSPDMSGKLPMHAELSWQGLNLETLRQNELKLILDHRKKEALYFDLKKDPAEKNPIVDIWTSKAREAQKSLEILRQGLKKARQTLKWSDQPPKRDKAQNRSEYKRTLPE